MNAPLQTPPLPTIAPYDLREHELVLDGCIPAEVRCHCGCERDVSYVGYRVNGGPECCRDCALEQLSLAIEAWLYAQHGEATDRSDEAGAMAAGMMEEAVRS